MNDKKVALLDADIYGPSIPMLMNLSGKPEISEVASSSY
jgi:ATP-binding protein involved in chromosome partitioning